MTGWARRVRRPPGPRELGELRDAAEALADESHRVPGRGRVTFQTISDVAILGTVLISGALATVHLYRSLIPRQREDHPGLNPDEVADSKPLHCGSSRHLTAAVGQKKPGRNRS
jgi:hypothetical protein